MYRPEELDQRITFQSEVETPDGQGGFTLSWQDEYTVWSKVKVSSGREYEAFDKVNASGLYLFVIRNRQDFDETYRIVWNGKPYNIRFDRTVGTRTLYLEITAERGVAQ